MAFIQQRGQRYPRQLGEQVPLNFIQRDHDRADGRTARTPGRRRRWPAAAAIAALTLLAAGCASSASTGSGSTAASTNSTGFTDGQVRLASTYPVSLAGPNQMLGYAAYFNYINQTQGGVKMANGKRYKIVFKYEDDGYDTGRAVANIKSFIATFHPAAIIGMTGSAINLATIGLLDQANIPDMYSSEGDDFWQQDVSKYPMFGPTQDPSDNLWMASQLAYIKSTWPGAKIALLAQNDAYGQDIVAAVKNDIKGTGLTLAATQWYNTGAPSVSTQVAALAATDATVFINTSLPPALTQSIEYAKTISWNVPDFICYSCANSSVLQPAGAAANNIYAPLVDVDPSIPQWGSTSAVTTLKSIVAKYGPTGASSSSPEDLDGAAFAELVVENLEASQPNSQSLINTMRHQGNTYDPLLLPGTTVATSPTYPYYVNKLTIAQYHLATNSWTMLGKPFTDPTYHAAG
jgi:branched-chain amino acid transport system substrate-binding protein